MSPAKAIARLRRLAEDWRREEARLCEQFGDVIAPQSMRARQIKDTQAIDAAVEMIERLEATEEDRSNFLVEIGKLCAQCDALRLRIEATEKARDALRAKIGAMERQEPYSYIYEYANPIDGSPVWRHTPGYWNAQHPRSSNPLYTLPGAQPAQSVPDGLTPLEAIQYWADTYANPKGDAHFIGHGVVERLLREYADLRAMLAAAPEAKP